MDERVSVSPRENARSCGFCRSEIDAGAPTWSCPACQTVQHQQCAGELGRCTVLGCVGESAWKGWTFRGREGPSDRGILSDGRMRKLLIMVALLFAAGGLVEVIWGALHHGMVQ